MKNLVLETCRAVKREYLDASGAAQFALMFTSGFVALIVCLVGKRLAG